MHNMTMDLLCTFMDLCGPVIQNEDLQYQVQTGPTETGPHCGPTKKGPPPFPTMDLLVGPTCGPTILGPQSGPTETGPQCGPTI